MQSPENPNLIQTPSPQSNKMDQKKPQLSSMINQYQFTAETKVPSARDSYGNQTISGMFSPQDPTGLKLHQFSKAKQYQSMQPNNSSRYYQATTAASFHKQTPSLDQNMTLNSTIGGQVGYTPLRHHQSELHQEDTPYRTTQESYIGGGGIGRSDLLSPQINRNMLLNKQGILSPPYLKSKQQSSPDAMTYMRTNQHQIFKGMPDDNLVQSKYISNNIPKQWVSEESDGLEDANPPYLENLNEHYFQIPQKQPHPERNTNESRFQEPYSPNKKENQDNIIEDDYYETQKRVNKSSYNQNLPHDQQIPFLKGSGFVNSSDGQQQQVFYPLQSKHSPDLSKYMIPSENLNKNQEIENKEKDFNTPQTGKDLAASIENFQLNSFRPEDQQQPQQQEENQNQFQQSFGKQQEQALKQYQSQLDQVKDQLDQQTQQNLGLTGQQDKQQFKNPVYIPKKGRVIIKTKPGQIPSKITISNPPNPERDAFYSRLAEEQRKILKQKQEQAQKKAELLSETMEFINQRLKV